MDDPAPTVFVVDDNAGIRRSLRWLLQSVGLEVETFPLARSFLEAYDPARPGCLVTDVRMPGMSGSELQERLVERGSPLPVIFITGYGDVPTAIRALKLGAEDFLQKPVSADVLIGRIQQALALDVERRRRQAELDARRARLERLTPRQREIAILVVQGHPTRTIAQELGLSVKTVEVHRAAVMAKLEARSLAELVRAVIALDEPGEPASSEPLQS